MRRPTTQARVSFQMTVNSYRLVKVASVSSSVIVSPFPFVISKHRWGLDAGDCPIRAALHIFFTYEF